MNQDSNIDDMNVRINEFIDRCPTMIKRVVVDYIKGSDNDGKREEPKAD